MRGKGLMDTRLADEVRRSQWTIMKYQQGIHIGSGKKLHIDELIVLHRR